MLHYECGDDGHYHASYESDHDGESTESGAERDILLIISLLNSLSGVAKRELESCYLREFNVGFECGDSWGLRSFNTAQCISGNCKCWMLIGSDALSHASS